MDRKNHTAGFKNLTSLNKNLYMKEACECELLKIAFYTRRKRKCNTHFTGSSSQQNDKCYSSKGSKLCVYSIQILIIDHTYRNFLFVCLVSQPNNTKISEILIRRTIFQTNVLRFLFYLSLIYFMDHILWKKNKRSFGL